MCTTAESLLNLCQAHVFKLLPAAPLLGHLNWNQKHVAKHDKCRQGAKSSVGVPLYTPNLTETGQTYRTDNQGEDNQVLQDAGSLTSSPSPTDSLSTLQAHTKSLHATTQYPTKEQKQALQHFSPTLTCKHFHNHRQTLTLLNAAKNTRTKSL